MRLQKLSKSRARSSRPVNLKPQIDVITTSRADFSLIGPVARELSSYNEVVTRLIVSGSHFGERGLGFFDGDETPQLQHIGVPAPGIGKSSGGSAAALAAMMAGFGVLWAKDPPALVVLLGDRFELLPIMSIAVLYGLPIAHLFGGEEDVSYCFDTQVRNALTKASHLHLVAHDAQRMRLLAMGEEAWRIHICGNPAIAEVEVDAENQLNAFDAWARSVVLPAGELIAACYLPATAVPGLWRAELEAIGAALDQFPERCVVWAGVNADPEAEDIRMAIEARCARHPRERFVAGLGRARYFGLLRRARLMLGNSSSGLLEAASFGLPVVNVGVRQTGRLSGQNVTNVPGDKVLIAKAISQYLSEGRPYHLKNPFWRSDTLQRIGSLLMSAARVDRTALMLKRMPGAEFLTAGLERVPEYPPYAEFNAGQAFLKA